ncbi:MAG: NAD(P)H-hydrate dehydratase [Desulfobacterales bacterium]|nr:NAD(P)H-hydrate dehydratase [Desulfobacterales bacterium]
MRVSTVQQMRAMDQSAIEQYAIPELVLMENAGLAAYRVLTDRWGARGRRILVCCGAGNNGGDGFVVARKILADGGQPVVLLLGDPSRYRGAARTNHDILDRIGTKVAPFEDLPQTRVLIDSCDLIVDAIFGTGLSKPVRGHYAEVIEMINAAKKPVLSLDIPSGINGDSGQIMGVAVRADATVTFGLPKVGNLLYPGAQHSGACYVTRISFPPALTRAPDLSIAVNHPPPLPARDPAGHKGTFGDVLFIAGASGYYGAPYLAAMAFLKAGGGYSRLAAPASVVPVIAARGSEIVFHPQAETPAGSLAYSNKADLLARIQKADMLVMGPGLSLDDETSRLVCELTEAADLPLLLDGDALTMLSRSPDRLTKRKARTVLTPHLGEMARLSNASIEDLKRDPVGHLQAATRRYRSAIVLKGAASMIGFPDGRILINRSGCDGMATAGAGDVLTGTIAAMYGLGLPFEAAVAKGVFVHGLAGELAAKADGADGVTAGTILAALPQAVGRDRETADSPAFEHYWGPQVI